MVADEVRKLAGQTKEAVGTVRGLAGEMGRLAELAGKDAADIAGVFKQYSSKTEHLAISLRENLEQINQAATAANEITKGVEAQASATSQLAESGQRLAAIAAFGSSCRANAEHGREAVVGELAEALRAAGEATPVRMLGARLADHAAFLEDVAGRAGAGGTVKSHTECPFGRWYFSEGQAAYGHLPVFRQLDTPHKALHDLAADLVRQAKAETVAELAEKSLELLKGFISLKKAIAELAASRARNGGRA